MIRTLYLHGPLEKYSKDPIQVNADDVPSLVRALDVLFPGFMRDLKKFDGFALAVADESGVDFIKPESLTWKFPRRKNLHMAVSEKGSGAEAAAFVAAAFEAGSFAYYAAYAITYIAVTVAIAYVVGQIAMSLAPKPDTKDGSTDERRSALFDRPVNLEGQGHPVPVLYGRFKVGSVVISADVNTEKNAVAQNDSISLNQSESKNGDLFSNDIFLDGGDYEIVSFTIEGSTYNAGQTHSSANLNLTVNANGTFNVLGTTAGNYTATYIAQDDTGARTNASLKIEVIAPFVWESWG